jgi:hypothetical protein
MSTPYNDLSKIRHVQQGDPVAERPTAQPTRAIERKLNQLQSQVSSISSSSELSKLVLRNVAIKTGDGNVTVDNVVYYNASSGLYEKAQAGVTFADGTFNFNPSSTVLGICVAVNNGYGDIMVGGYDNWRDANHYGGMMEGAEDYLPGVPYYLSANEPGKITRFAPALRIQVLVGTGSHFVVQPVYSNPESIESLARVPMGMRPVGGIRSLPDSFNQHVIVGFDALELFDQTAGVDTWRTTEDSDVSSIASFGYMVADAQMVLVPDAPIYVRISTAIGGSISIFSAMALEDLYSGGGGTFNLLLGVHTLFPSSEATERTYTIKAAPQDNTVVGTLRFKFVSDDTTLRRDVIFKVPDSFQGWKMINAPITPLATAAVASESVTSLTVVEPSIGYATAPTVVISGTGDITVPAEVTAVLDEFGSVSRLNVDEAGEGYLTATVAFTADVDTVTVAPGGSGAVIGLSCVDGEIVAATVDSGGSGYLQPPSVQVLDSAGSGAIITVTVRGGVVTAAHIVSQGVDYSTSPIALVRPSGVSSYVKTTPGVFEATLTGDGVGSVTRTAGVAPVPTGGWGYPINPKVTLTGGDPTTPAEVTATVDPVTRSVTGFTIDEPGAGYVSAPTVSVQTSDPVLVVTGGDLPNDGVAASGTVVCPSLKVLGFNIKNAGYGYKNYGTEGVSMPTVLTGGLALGGVAATVLPIVETSTGRIIEMRLLSPGSGYVCPPTISINDTAGGNHGNGFDCEVLLDTVPTSVTVDEPGFNYRSKPLVELGVPVASIDMLQGGSGYVTVPIVTIEPPALAEADGGVTATAVARMGNSLRRIKIMAQGSGYVNPVITITGDGYSASALAVLDGSGKIVGVELVDHGYGFTSTPIVTVTGAPGSAADLVAELDGASGQVVRLDLTTSGCGYTRPPQITIEASPTGAQAIAQAHLMGEGCTLITTMHGDGGTRLSQTTNPAEGNRLQVRDYGDDLNNPSNTTYKKPNGAAFYYNIKADPTLSSRWPAVPITRALFTLNGTELESTTFNEATGELDNPMADILFSARTPMWTTLDADGCPWDREYRHYVYDEGASGSDALIPDTGHAPEFCWRFWEHTYKYEPNRNTGQMHINQASRFYQSGRVAGLGAVAPLRLIDVATGAESRNDGTLMTGQLMLVMDNQTNLFDGTGAQVNTTVTNEIVPIFVNTYGRPVAVTSVLLMVAYQAAGVGIATVSDAALITVGTQDGNYRDIIGTFDATAEAQSGVSCCLYRPNTVKTLIPDARESTPLILPNQVVYLRIDYPCNTTSIPSQLITAKVKGHVL